MIDAEAVERLITPHIEQKHNAEILLLALYEEELITDDQMREKVKTLLIKREWIND